MAKPRKVYFKIPYLEVDLINYLESYTEKLEGSKTEPNGDYVIISGFLSYDDDMTVAGYLFGLENDKYNALDHGHVLNIVKTRFALAKNKSIIRITNLSLDGDFKSFSVQCVESNLNSVLEFIKSKTWGSGFSVRVTDGEPFGKFPCKKITISEN